MEIHYPKRRIQQDMVHYSFLLIHTILGRIENNQKKICSMI